MCQTILVRSSHCTALSVTVGCGRALQLSRRHPGGRVIPPEAVTGPAHAAAQQGGAGGVRAARRTHARAGHGALRVRGGAVPAAAAAGDGTRRRGTSPGVVGEAVGDTVVGVAVEGDTVLGRGGGGRQSSRRDGGGDTVGDTVVCELASSRPAARVETRRASPPMTDSSLGLQAWEKGLHLLVRDAINGCHPSLHAPLAAAVTLSGGTTMLPGLAARLTKELRCVARSSLSPAASLPSLSLCLLSLSPLTVSPLTVPPLTVSPPASLPSHRLLSLCLLSLRLSLTVSLSLVPPPHPWLSQPRGACGLDGAGAQGRPGSPRAPAVDGRRAGGQPAHAGAAQVRPYSSSETTT
jgi:hypothetical protein